ncbi:MAG: hypothetical protein KDA89_24955 [Planctomycetaceae bacterium]|nr:hypothetical protein [Planctomycetaceae bacterium]
MAQWFVVVTTLEIRTTRSRFVNLLQNEKLRDKVSQWQTIDTLRNLRGEFSTGCDPAYVPSR